MPSVVIDEMSPADLERTLAELANRLNKARVDAHELQESYKILKTNKDRTFATIVDKQQGNTISEKNRKALISNEWGEWLDVFFDTMRRADRAKLNADNIERLWDTCRSVLSSKNSERRTCT